MQMDRFLQDQYRALVAEIQSNADIPEDVCRLFEMITERGGEEFGIKGAAFTINSLRP